MEAERRIGHDVLLRPDAAPCGCPELHQKFRLLLTTRIHDAFSRRRKQAFLEVAFGEWITGVSVTAHTGSEHLGQVMSWGEVGPLCALRREANLRYFSRVVETGCKAAAVSKFKPATKRNMSSFG